MAYASVRSQCTGVASLAVPIPRGCHGANLSRLVRAAVLPRCPATPRLPGLSLSRPCRSAWQRMVRCCTSGWSLELHSILYAGNTQRVPKAVYEPRSSTTHPAKLARVLRTAIGPARCCARQLSPPVWRGSLALRSSRGAALENCALQDDVFAAIA